MNKGGKAVQKVLCTLIELYQKIAPIRIRQSCRFEPTCSNYMIMAIHKYGSIKGISLGINRLFRCRYPNGGQDCP
ncbi:MAG: membrane protein insertion efficiency factor YidD [Leptospirales bacterium]|nr:membrane protein insertion efficiency factor YidD [Leptospirales bacterium]